MHRVHLVGLLGLRMLAEMRVREDKGTLDGWKGKEKGDWRRRSISWWRRWG